MKPTKRPQPKPVKKALTKDDVFAKVMMLLEYADTLEENGCEDESKAMRKAVDDIGAAVLKLGS